MTTSCDCGYCAGLAGHRTFFADDPRAVIEDAATPLAPPARVPAMWGTLFGLGGRWQPNAARHWRGGFRADLSVVGLEASNHARR